MIENNKIWLSKKFSCITIRDVVYFVWVTLSLSIRYYVLILNYVQTSNRTFMQFLSTPLRYRSAINLNFQFSAEMSTARVRTGKATPAASSPDWKTRGNTPGCAVRQFLFPLQVQMASASRCAPGKSESCEPKIGNTNGFWSVSGGISSIPDGLNPPQISPVALRQLWCNISYSDGKNSVKDISFSLWF